MSLFKPKILKAIDQIKQKKRPDIKAIYEYLSKIEASNAEKNLFETILGNLIETNILVNRKTPEGLDSFQTGRVYTSSHELLNVFLNVHIPYILEANSKRPIRKKEKK